jgi:hypothetical protein
MFQIHCSTIEEIDAAWRMLAYVPDADFIPAEIYLAGTCRYVVVRIDGEQTAAPPADPPGYSCPTA